MGDAEASDEMLRRRFRGTVIGASTGIHLTRIRRKFAV